MPSVDREREGVAPDLLRTSTLVPQVLSLSLCVLLLSKRGRARWELVLSQARARERQQEEEMDDWFERSEREKKTSEELGPFDLFCKKNSSLFSGRQFFDGISLQNKHLNAS